MNATRVGRLLGSALPFLLACGSLAQAPVIFRNLPGSSTSTSSSSSTSSSTTSGATTSTTSSLLFPGAIAEYQFPGGSGTSVLDLSGNSNNATLGNGSAAPLWSAGGLVFAPLQNVALPSALNGTRTFYVLLYLNPLPPNNAAASAAVFNQYPVLISSSGGSSGWNWALAKSKTIYDMSNSTAFSTTEFSNNSHLTQTQALISGYHVLAYTLGSSTAGSGDLDHVYFDGKEVPAYDAQGQTAGLQTTGHLFLGSSLVNPWQISGVSGTLIAFGAFSQEHTAGQVAVLSGNSLLFGQRFGFRSVPLPNPTSTPTLTCGIDSLTYGYPTGYSWCAHLSLTNQPAYTINNVGITGMTVEGTSGSAANREALNCKGSTGPNPAILWGGTNDLTTGGESPEQTFDYLMSEVATLKQAGCGPVFVATMISRNGMDAVKDTFDNLLLSRAVASGADGVIDFASILDIGADGTSATSAFVDGTHVGVPQQNEIAAAASNALNFWFGFKPGSPHVISASIYAMTAADGAVSLTQGTALTAPDCTGLANATYTITNASSTSGTITGLPGPGVAPSTNLYNPAADTQSVLINQGDGTQTAASFGGYASTGLIPLAAGAAWSTNLAVGQYNTGGQTYGGAYYTANGVYLAGLGNHPDTLQPQTFTAPNVTGVQVRFYYKTSSSANPQTAGVVNEGTSVIAWNAYVQGSSGITLQPINGSTANLPVPANSTLQMVDVSNPKSVAGCHWLLH